MGAVTRTRVVKIGNSQGIRIPKLLLQQAGLTENVELEAEDGRLVVRSVHHPREGWDEEFRKMHEAGDDKLLDAEPLVLTKTEETEWEW
jgi:antitoxin MazE